MKGSLPIQACPQCGCTWFREATLNQFGRDDRVAGFMPMTVLVCLCGAPLWRGVGGIRGGRTPNLAVDLWAENIKSALSHIGQMRVTAAEIDPAEFATRVRMEAMEAVLKQIERQLGRSLSRRSKSQGGRPWSLPRRAPTTNGRDQMVVALQRIGYTFRDARRLVGQVWAVIRDALRRGESVETPIGTFEVAPAPPPQERERFGKCQVTFRNRYRVVFRPKEL